jgi:hypothetical protein
VFARNFKNVGGIPNSAFLASKILLQRFFSCCVAVLLNTSLNKSLTSSHWWEYRTLHSPGASNSKIWFVFVTTLVPGISLSHSSPSPQSSTSSS